MAKTVRRLRDSDSSDIKEISRHVWEGHDYLPSVADQWLHDPDCHFHGVEVDDHVVGVGNLRIIENGLTGWMEGLRVHPEYRGRGLANDITRYLVRRAEELGVRRLRYTTSSRNDASVKLAKMAGFSKILEMAVSWHTKPKTIPIVRDYPPIRKQNPKRACSMLKTKAPIVPNGILIYNWKALDSTCENLEEIGKTNEFHIALKGRKMDSLSLVYSGQEPNHSWLSFTIYATDSHGFLAQLSHNVAMALEHGSNSIACTFETKFEETMKMMNLGSQDHEEGHLVLFEKQMHIQK